MLAVALLCTLSTPAFAQNFNPADFTLTTSNSNGFVTPNAPSGFYLQGTNGLSGSGDTKYTTTIGSSGVVSFDWSAHSNDVNAFFFDPFSISVNGVNIVHVEGGVNQIYDASGQVWFTASAGDVLAFDIFSKDGCCGPGTATISNYDAVPEPGSMFLLGTGLLGLGGTIRRKIRL
jgi:hypothetical protein